MTLSILLPGPFALLKQKLDQAVAADPSLAPARARLLLPLELLAALAPDAEPALADDPLAASRVRLLLVAGGSHGIPPVASSALLPGDVATPGAAPAPDPSGATPGLLDLGVLILVALAAGRAGAATRLEHQLARTVFGLAFASGIAEAIAGQGAAGLAPAQLRVLLAALLDPEARASAWSSVVGSFLADPAERARWATLDALQSQVLEQLGSDQPWDGALARGISAIEPVQACAGSQVQVKGKLSVQDPATLRAVFASGVTRPRAAPATLSAEGLTAVVPAGAAAGWLGYTDDKIRSAANALRARLRGFWRDQNARNPGLAGTPVPVESIRDLGDPPSPPPGGANRFRGGRPTILRAQLVDAAAGGLAFEWSVEGAVTLRLEPLPDQLAAHGSMLLDQATLPADGKLTLRATNGCGEAATEMLAAPVIDRVWVTQGARTSGFVSGQPFTAHAVFHFRAPHSWSWPALLSTMEPGGAPGPQPAPSSGSAAASSPALPLGPAAAPSIRIAAPQAAQTVRDGFTVTAVVSVPGDVQSVHVEVLQAGLPINVGDIAFPDGAPGSFSSIADLSGESDGPAEVRATVLWTDRSTPPVYTTTTADPVALTIDLSDPLLTFVSGPGLAAPVSGAIAGLAAVVELPGSAAKDGFIGGLAVSRAFARNGDAKPIGPLRFVEPTAAIRLVAVRPAVFASGFARVSDALLARAVAFAEARLGNRIELIEPVWLEDEDLVVNGEISAPDAPGASDLLERLERFAASQPGLEDACWVALLPDAPWTDVPAPDRLAMDLTVGGPAALVVTAPAECARRVAVSTASGLAQALDALPEAEPVAPRLRLRGSIDRRLRLRLDTARLESRATGPGAAHDTGLTAVALDRAGRELVVRPVAAVRAGLPVEFACLLPMSAEIVTVELRAGARVLQRLDRPPGAPELSLLRLEGSTVGWSYHHSQGMSPQVTIEMAQGRGWCPVARAAPCDRTVTLSLGRLRRNGVDPVLRVTATDGWSAAELPAPQLPAVPARYVVARAAASGQFWADTNDGGTAAWFFNGLRVEGPLYQSAAGARGVLTLAVTDDAGNTFTDSRSIGG